MENGAPTLENILKVLQKMKWNYHDQAIPFPGVNPREMNVCSNDSSVCLTACLCHCYVTQIQLLASKIIMLATWLEPNHLKANNFRNRK